MSDRSASRGDMARALLGAAAAAGPRALVRGLIHAVTSAAPLLTFAGLSPLRSVAARTPGALRRLIARRGWRATLYGELPGADSAPRVLLVTHDLSATGAPKIVLEMAAAFRGMGCHVVVLAPGAGPFLEPLRALGVAVLLDEDLLGGGGVAPAFGRLFDLAVCNTVVTERVVASLGPRLACFWYIHEVSLLEARLGDPALAAAAGCAREVWAGSEISARLIRPLRPDVAVFPYGLDPVEAPARADTGGALRIGVFGSIEPRKGQDLAVEAIGRLAADVSSQVELTLFGRRLEAAFSDGVLARLAKLPRASYGGELGYEGYLEALRGMDAVMVPSRDDTLPLVSLDALSAERVLLLTATVGTSVYLRDGVDAFVAEAPTAVAIAGAIERAVRARGSWSRIAAAGREVFSLRFSKDAFVQRLAAVLAQALQTPGGREPSA